MLFVLFPAVRQAPPPAPAQSGGGGSILGGIGSTIAQGNEPYPLLYNVLAVIVICSGFNIWFLFPPTGMAFGGGSAVAHRAVDAVMGPRTIQHETVATEATAAPVSMANSDACSSHSKAFQDVCNLFYFLYILFSLKL